VARAKIKTQYPVKDATRDLVLHITEADIKGAKRRDNNDCAAAHALCRQEGFKAARIYKTMTYVFNRDGSATRYCTPKSLYIEMLIYDRGGRFAPGEHKLIAPRGVKRLGMHEKPKGLARNATGRPVKSIHIVGGVRDNAPKGIGSLKALFS
jgi:hypothetical protein